jgi:Uma2 family endonuclease
MANTHQASLEHYLQTSYRPDREYADGVVSERNLGLSPHARTQALLTGWLFRYEAMWSTVSFSGPRVQVSPSRIRVPDIGLFSRESQPQSMADPPLLAVEVISPEDTYSDTQVRVQDYLDMGVKTVWTVDPWTRTGRVCDALSWRECSRLVVDGTPIYAELNEVFE